MLNGRTGDGQGTGGRKRVGEGGTLKDEGSAWKWEEWQPVSQA